MTLKIILRVSEILPFMNFINRLFEQSMHDIEVVDYYNLRKFCKQLFDRHYKLFNTAKKQITIPVDINLLDSLVRLAKLNVVEMQKTHHNYCKVLYQDVLLQLNRQQVNLSMQNLLD